MKKLGLPDREERFIAQWLKLEFTALGSFLYRTLLPTKISNVLRNSKVQFLSLEGLLSGLREDEMIYSHSKEICPDNAGHKCDRLHVINKSNGMTVVTLNWFRGNKQCYFFIIPTNIWDHLRRLPRFTRKEEIISAHNIAKREAGIKFMDLRKLNYNVVRNTMDPNEADILAGRAKTVSAQHYALYQRWWWW